MFCVNAFGNPSILVDLVLQPSNVAAMLFATDVSAHVYAHSFVDKCTHCELRNTSRLTHMSVCFLTFTLISSIYSRQWDQKIGPSEWVRKTIPSCLPCCYLQDASHLLSLMIGPQSFHLHCDRLHLSPEPGLLSHKVSSLNCSPLPLHVFKTSATRDTQTHCLTGLP